MALEPTPPPVPVRAEGKFSTEAQLCEWLRDQERKAVEAGLEFHRVSRRFVCGKGYDLTATFQAWPEKPAAVSAPTITE